MDEKQAELAVRDYVSLCEAWRLPREYHPTLKGAWKIIYCRDDADRARVAAAYRAQTGRTE